MVISASVVSGLVNVCKHTFIDDIILDDLSMFTINIIEFNSRGLDDGILYRVFVIKNSLIVFVSKAFLNLLNTECGNFNIFTQILQDVLFNIYYNLSNLVNSRYSDYDLKVLVVLDDTLNKKKKM